MNNLQFTCWFLVDFFEENYVLCPKKFSVWQLKRRNPLGFYFIRSISFLCHGNKWLQVQWITITWICYLTVVNSGGQKSKISLTGPKSRCQQGWLLLETLRGKSTSLLFSSFSEATLGLQPLLPSSKHTILPSLVMSPKSFLTLTSYLPFKDPCYFIGPTR